MKGEHITSEEGPVVRATHLPSLNALIALAQLGQAVLLSALRSTRLKCSGLALIALHILAISSASGQDQTLRIREVGSWAVPNGFSLAGMGGNDSGQVVLWSHDAGFLIVLDSGLAPVRRVPLPSGMMPVEVDLVGERGVEVITADPPELHYLSFTGAVDSTIAIERVGTLIDAGRAPDRWLVVMEHPDGAITIGGPRGLGGLVERAYGSVVARNDGSLFTELLYPFRVRSYDRAGRSRAEFGPPLPTLDSLRAEGGQRDFQTWASLATLPLDHGYLQTITDVAADRRVLVLYDDRGRVTRLQVLHVPLGFAISSPRHKVLIASRRGNIVEIVKYRWHWSRTEPFETQDDTNVKE